MSLYKESIAFGASSAITLASTLVLATSTFAQSSGNTIVHTNVVNTLGSKNPITVNRESHSRVTNPGSNNIHIDTNIVVAGSCHQSTVNNNVSHEGSKGVNSNIVVDVCNPAAGAASGRQNVRKNR